MATTAGIQLTSSLLSNAMSVNSSTSCMKAGTTADSLDQMDTGYVEVASGVAKELLNATTLGINKANKVYLCNESTDETYYVIVTVKAEVLGRLYAGDWMFIPWSAALDAAEIEIEPQGGTNTIEYAFFNSDFILTTAA